MSRGHFAAVAAAFTLVLAAPAAAHADSFPLVGWWPMNEGSGQVVHDWSGHGNNGMLGSTSGADANDPTWVKGVFFGSALNFDGLNDYVSIPSSASLQPQRLTVDAWVRASATPGKFRYIVSNGSIDCLTSAYGLYTGVNGGLAFFIADSPTHYYVTPEAPLSLYDGQWHNVGGTFDGKTVKLFVDGNLIGSTAAPATIDYDLTDHSSKFGDYDGTCGSDALTLAGDIDGVQIWSQALPIDTIWRTLKPLLTLAR